MSWLYNRRFKIGAGLAAVGFVVANVISYVAASRRGAELLHIKIKFSGSSYLVWGWPFRWTDPLEAGMNLAVLLFGSLFFGLLFRWISGIIK
jgi:hypothetical protein